MSLTPTPDSPTAALDKPGAVEAHIVTFQRSTLVRDHWRAWCSCGWMELGTQAQVESRAACHDIDWVVA